MHPVTRKFITDTIADAPATPEHSRDAAEILDALDRHWSREWVLTVLKQIDADQSRRPKGRKAS